MGFFTRIRLALTAARKILSLEPFVPNAETVEAMNAARRGELDIVGNLDSLLADLNTDDSIGSRFS